MLQRQLRIIVSIFMPALFGWGAATVAVAQAAAAAGGTSYDPRLTFAPLALPEPVNEYRSSNGAPGPAYWQNEADYVMHAELDTRTKALRNDEVITYTNNSPDALTSLWIHMEQNIYRKDARAQIVNGGLLRRRRTVPDSEENPNGRTTDGFVLDAVEIERGSTRAKAAYLISDTRMQIRLDEAAGAEGRRAEGAYQVSLRDSGGVGRAHFVGHVETRRDL